MSDLLTSAMCEYVCCDQCGSWDHTILYSKIDHITNWEFHVVECGCGMVFVNPMPFQEHIGLLYPHHYLDEKPLLDSLYEKMMNTVPSDGTNNRLLDIGCGRGDFIRYANSSGWFAEGVDFSDWSGDKNDVKIHVGDFSVMDFPQSSFDVITAWAVIEHVRKPSDYFKRAAELLRPNGKFVFTVPNVASPGMKYSCDEDTPRHLWLFTPDTVQKYISRSNFRLEHAYHDGAIYRAYPFGMVRRGIYTFLGKNGLSCDVYQNKSVALLENKPMDVYFKTWMSNIFKKLSITDIGIDAIDLGLGIMVGTVAKILKNYGVMTIVATKI